MHANDVNNDFCRVIKYFRGGLYISNIFVLGGPNISIYLDRGGTKIGGTNFHDRSFL